MQSVSNPRIYMGFMQPHRQLSIIVWHYNSNGCILTIIKGLLPLLQINYIDHLRKFKLEDNQSGSTVSWEPKSFFGATVPNKKLRINDTNSVIAIVMVLIYTVRCKPLG